MKNNPSQPQSNGVKDEHLEGPTKEVCVSIFGHVKDLEIRNGEFPLVPSNEEVKTSTGMFNFQMSQIILIKQPPT